MEAREKSLKFIQNEKRIVIPFFQRAYVWDSDNWTELFDDLTKDKSHFLGSIILKQRRRSGEVSQAIVIDGQQRLTTLSILIRAIYDSFTDEIKKNTANMLNSSLFYKLYDTDEEQLIKITHSRRDGENYKLVIEGICPEEQKSECKVFACYHYFRKRLAKMTMEGIKMLWNKMLDEENKMLVVIDIKDDEDEQAIFDTINTAGVKLTSADSIKNNIFQRGYEIFGNGNVKIEEFYDKYWDMIFSADEEKAAFWSAQRATGRLMRENIEIFLQSYAIIKGIYDPAQNKLTDLTVLYKKYFSDNTNLDNYESTIKELSEYAKLYRDKIILCDNTMEYSNSDTEKRLFHLLQVFGITTFHAYILKLYHDYANDNAQLLEKLKHLEQYIVYNALVGSNEKKKNYNKICIDFIRETKQPETELNIISREQIIKGVSDIDNKYAIIWLFYVELYRRQQNSAFDRDTLNYVYELEHIMPQKWKEYWSNVPVVDEDGEVISDELRAEQLRYGAIYSIGNMTLLRGGLNKSVRNYLLVDKIQGEANNKRRKGMKEYADLDISKRDIIDKYQDGTTWNELTIKARTESLVDEIMACWDLEEKFEPKTTDDNGDRPVVRGEIFSFTKCRIPVGAELEFVNDTSIRCTVAGDSKVMYQGRTMYMTGLVKQLLNTTSSLAGPLYFSYKGKKLQEYYNQYQTDSNNG